MTEPTAEAAEAPTPVVQFKKRAPKAKAAARKRSSPSPKPAGGDSSDSDFSSDNDQDQTIKKRKMNSSAISTSSSTNKRPSSTAPTATTSKPTHPLSTNDATKQSNWFDEVDENNKEKQLLGNTRSLQKEPTNQPGGTYKGLANQTTFIQRNPNAAPKKSFGPVKAPTNVRTTTFFDYKPDVCKDYKLTGFCGFGDSCIYLHDRGDYKQGWELEREWENVTKGGKKVEGTIISRRGARNDEKKDDDDDDDLTEDIPFACIICQGPYKDPIMTKCGHYFCEGCALNRYKKDPTCMACGAGTGGVFNTAKRLKQLLDKKRQKMQAEEDEEEDEEEDDDDDDE